MMQASPVAPLMIHRRPVSLRDDRRSPLANFQSRTLDANCNNNNSPGHNSSQDGSFIQDEDMHLILDFGGFKLSSPINGFNPPVASGLSAAYAFNFVDKEGNNSNNNNNAKNSLQRCLARGGGDDSTNVTSSMYRRQRAEWATNFDADIVAQLDFDEFSVQRDMALLNGNIGFPYDDQMVVSGYDDCCSSSFTGADCLLLQNSACRQRPTPTRFNKSSRRNKQRRIITRSGGDDSMETSLLFDISGENLATSSIFYAGQTTAAGGDDDNDIFVLGNDCSCEEAEHEDGHSSLVDNDKAAQTAGGGGAFISTDSLDFSSLSAAEENLRQACTTNKREYVLTFDKNAFESGLAIFSATGTDNNDSSIVASSSLASSSCVDDYGKAVVRLDDIALDVSRDLEEVGGDGEADVTMTQQEHPGPNVENDISNNNNNNNVVTWRRIKSSYDNKATNFSPSSKYFSLPDLKPSTSGVTVAGQEKLVSPDCPRNYNDNNNEHIDKNNNENNCANLNGRVSLLKVFQEQQNLYKLPTIVNGMNNILLNESGYATGTGSNLNNNYNDHYYYNNNNNDNISGHVTGNSYYLINDDQFVDLNHNEIMGYIPPFGNIGGGADIPTAAAGYRKPPPPPKPPRSFSNVTAADDCDDVARKLRYYTSLPNVLLSRPDLEFLKFPFDTPSLGLELTPFLVNFLNDTVRKSSCCDDDFLSANNDNNFQKNDALLLAADPPKLAPPPKIDNDQWKTGAAAANGPSHIEDWDSLAVLLPDNVLKACRFFRQNSDLFRGDSIDKPAAAATSPPRSAAGLLSPRSNKGGGGHFSFDRSSLSPPDHKIAKDNNALLHQQQQQCGCAIRRTGGGPGQKMYWSDAGPNNNSRSSMNNYISTRQAACRCCCCCPQRFAGKLERWTCIGSEKSFHREPLHKSCIAEEELDLMDHTSDDRVKLLTMLIEKITHSVSDIVAEFKAHQSALEHADVTKDKSDGRWPIGTQVFDSLCPALECLLTDGLKERRTICDVMQAFVLTDSITKSVCSLIVGNIDASKAAGKSRERSLQFAVFIDSLLNSKSIGNWMSKLTSDRATLTQNYSEAAYVRLLSIKKYANLADWITNSLDTLSRLPFEKLSLISMEIRADEGQQQQQQEQNNAKVKVDAQSKNSSRLVVVQKELKIVFHFPSRILMSADDDNDKTQVQPPPSRPSMLKKAFATMSRFVEDSSLPSKAKKRTPSSPISDGSSIIRLDSRLPTPVSDSSPSPAIGAAAADLPSFWRRRSGDNNLFYHRRGKSISDAGNATTKNNQYSPKRMVYCRQAPVSPYKRSKIPLPGGSRLTTVCTNKMPK